MQRPSAVYGAVNHRVTGLSLCAFAGLGDCYEVVTRSEVAEFEESSNHRKQIRDINNASRLPSVVTNRSR